MHSETVVALWKIGIPLRGNTGPSSYVASYATLTYIELGLKSCPPSTAVPQLQLLNGTNQSRGWDLCVPTSEGLQDSIMDEHILFLVRSQGERVLRFQGMTCMCTLL